MEPKHLSSSREQIFERCADAIVRNDCAALEALLAEHSWLATHVNAGGFTLLDDAITYDRADMVDALLRAGAPANTREAGDPPLAHAVDAGNTQIIKMLLNAGADPDTIDQLRAVSVLAFAAWKGARAVAELLIAAGADLNYRPDNVGEGETPLWLAASEGHEELVRLLLQAGANPSIRDRFHNLTPAEIAARNGHFNLKKLLAE